MNIILASTSTLFGGQYLAYLSPQLEILYKDINTILFIPYARPGGISLDEYTLKAKESFEKIGKNLVGIHEFDDKIEAVNNAEAYFTGGGNTFLLVNDLHNFSLMQPLAYQIGLGKPYLGCSAGSNIAGINMKTTNDMPIVYPPSFDCLKLVPFNINPHYLDPLPNLKHNGETRETRINEFHTQNDIKVIGLREGNWIRVSGDKITTEGTELTRVFNKNTQPIEILPGTKL